MAAAASKRINPLRRRADFKRLAKGLRRNCPAFTLQAAPAEQAEGRFGLTITRKVGSATERNRIRRRLKAALSQVDQCFGLDAVIVARRDCLSRRFAHLKTDLDLALRAADQKLSQRTH